MYIFLITQTGPREGWAVLCLLSVRQVLSSSAKSSYVTFVCRDLVDMENDVMYLFILETKKCNIHAWVARRVIMLAMSSIFNFKYTVPGLL